MVQLGWHLEWTFEASIPQKEEPWEALCIPLLCPSLVTTCFKMPQKSVLDPSSPYVHLNLSVFHVPISVPISLARPNLFLVLSHPIFWL